MKKSVFIGLILLFTCIISCEKISVDYDDRKMAMAPDAGDPVCDKFSSEAYNLTIGSWRDSAQITYAIANYPAGWARSEIESVVLHAFSQWEEHIPQTIVQIPDTSRAMIKIRFDYLDGVGGQLGSSEFPPASRRGRQQVLLTFDRYDIQPDPKEGVSAYDFFSIALHESGHALGLKHSDIRHAVMAPAYTRPIHSLDPDDVMGIRYQYHNNCTFRIQEKTYLWLTPGDHRPVSKNFKRYEFYSKCSSPRGGHYLDSTVIVGAQFLREYYGQPIRIISTFRHSECNHAAGGASLSQHLFNGAVDFKFVGTGWQKVHKAYQSDIKNRRVVFTELLSRGIRGFGGYPTSNHLDSRVNGTRIFGLYKISLWGTLDPNGYNTMEDDLNLYQ
jgi:hypothetical protein